MSAKTDDDDNDDGEWSICVVERRDPTIGIVICVIEAGKVDTPSPSG